MKQTITFDYDTSKALQYYLTYNGIINIDIPNREMYDMLFAGFREPNYIIKHNEEEAKILNRHYQNFNFLYTLLTLYDSIRIQPFSYGLFDNIKTNESNLGEAGISYVEKNIYLPNDNILNKAEEIFTNNIDTIISNCLNDDSCMDYSGHPRDQVIKRYLDNKLYKSNYKEKKQKHHKKRYPMINTQNWFMRNYYDGFETAIYNYFDKTFISIIDALEQGEGTLYSRIFNVNNLSGINQNKCDELNSYIVKADFSSGINVIPKPETFNDVIKLRQDENLISFRRVFNEWIFCLQNNDIDYFIKMKNDVLKANKNLEKLSKFERVNNSVFVRILTIIGGYIPILSEILTGIGFVTPFVTDKIRLENSWVLLPAFREDYKSYIY